MAWLVTLFGGDILETDRLRPRSIRSTCVAGRSQDDIVGVPSRAHAHVRTQTELLLSSPFRYSWLLLHSVEYNLSDACGWAGRRRVVVDAYAC